MCFVHSSSNTTWYQSNNVLSQGLHSNWNFCQPGPHIVRTSYVISFMQAHSHLLWITTLSIFSSLLFWLLLDQDTFHECVSSELIARLPWPSVTQKYNINSVRQRKPTRMIEWVRRRWRRRSCWLVHFQDSSRADSCILHVEPASWHLKKAATLIKTASKTKRQQLMSYLIVMLKTFQLKRQNGTHKWNTAIVLLLKTNNFIYKDEIRFQDDTESVWYVLFLRLHKITHTFVGHTDLASIKQEHANCIMYRAKTADKCFPMSR